MRPLHAHSVRCFEGCCRSLAKKAKNYFAGRWKTERRYEHEAITFSLKEVFKNMADGHGKSALSVGLIFLLLIRNLDNCIRLCGQTGDLDKISLVKKKLLNGKWNNTGG